MVGGMAPRVRTLAAVALGGTLLGALAALSPEKTVSTALSLFWGAVLLLLVASIGRRSLGNPWLVKVALVGLVVRGPLALAHLFVAYVAFGGRVDLFQYFEAAQAVAESVIAGEGEFFSLDLSRGGILSLGWEMVARIFALGYFIFGPSVGALLFMSGLLGFWGSYLFLRAYQVTFGFRPETRLFAVLVMFFPSLAFWTGLLGKDSLMFLGLGLVAYGVARFTAAFRLRYLLVLGAGLVLILIVRRPTLLAVGMAAAVAMVLSLRHRLWTTGPAVILRPVGYAVTVSLIVASAAVVVTPVRAYFLESTVTSEGVSPETLSEGVLAYAVHRHIGLATDTTTRRGSSIEVAIETPTPQAALAYLPLGMFTFLFRPLIFEAHNVVALVSAIEGSLLMALVIWKRRNLWQALRSSLAVPFTAFCWISFGLLTAGLAFETNFGAIVRHRSMVLAFLFALLAFPLDPLRGRGRPASRNPTKSLKVDP